MNFPCFVSMELRDMVSVNPKFDGGTANSLAITEKRRFVFLDGLRGIAATWVVLFHAYTAHHMDGLRPFMPRPLQTLFQSGSFGVQIFFVLSGFVIALSVGQAWVTPGYFGRFVLRRSIRLDPPYWASIALCIAMLSLARATVVGKTTQLPGWSDLVAHLFYLQVFLNYKQINDVYWTLCMEVQFYLVYCLWLGISQCFRRRESDVVPLYLFFGFAALASIFWRVVLDPAHVNRGFFLPLWYGFLLGVFAFWAVTGKTSWWFFYAYVASLAVEAGIYRDPCIVALSDHGGRDR